MYDERLSALEISDYADEQWFLGATDSFAFSDVKDAEWIDELTTQEIDETFNILHLEQTKSILKEIADKYKELYVYAQILSNNIDKFIELYLNTEKEGF